MSWLENVVRPKIRTFLSAKRDTPENLWHKCKNCGEMVFHRDLAENLQVCPNCDHHGRIGAKERLDSLFDGGTWQKIDNPEVPADPLKFRDQRKYTDRLKEARTKTGEQDAVTIALGQLGGREATVLVQDFAFMGGSLGMAAGESIVKGAELAIERRTPFIIFAAAGGARMQEGILSLMQMPRSTVAVQMVREAGLPYIVVMTDPTTGGVTASYAMLGDVHIAEPGALIGFAGPRVIEQTIREKLPEGFQRAEYLLDHGMVDMVVKRGDMRDTLIRLTSLLMVEGPAAAATAAPQIAAPAASGAGTPPAPATGA
ncbi:acetyl-CoA carboxylase, carboxyltransferase subunit beta [Pyruvatibacter mobilis]|uniref:Acetyl-coenzyme A carboxylase carboxyl transferase subunit beta n=1 Tax=Pyruvatibacter mobilis TaxID=1712261 RepID=A0A845Q9H8_9HYPH|nr:acetyl-CoA carboxylase, carboxyltransferase subunit beta [Pyruvatibacter mobilis]NBG94850.1 acetyl-CoA carboxylase carboxyltransferase subunit beta [Pyruvatibacter mobilis]QJD76073.1 acetyl-CoA carboxylase carboxyltransferase subunit beta [Pyruvatibacter mobilis]GGD20944.1 acetyl-coenzyme A carboxylase carboxyl transferase subunit beta [Pyruvatibacter mobilis]